MEFSDSPFTAKCLFHHTDTKVKIKSRKAALEENFWFHNRFSLLRLKENSDSPVKLNVEQQKKRKVVKQNVIYMVVDSYLNRFQYSLESLSITEKILPAIRLEQNKYIFNIGKK